MTTLEMDQYWSAALTRDSAYDGRFYVGVLTTGIYCRPSCPARKPLRKNVRFYETPADAERDGLRACLRCRPLACTGLDPATERVRALCRYLEQNCEQEISLASLAERAGISPFHLQRSFRAILGVSPKEYREACRMRLLKESLRAAPGVTAAIYDAGFGSSRGVYSRSDAHLGMTPAQYRRGGKNVAISYAIRHTAFGLLMVAATERGICFVQFGDSPEQLQDRLRKEYPAAAVSESAQDPLLDEWMTALRRHIESGVPAAGLPIDIQATAFQTLVWKYLQTIPCGEVRSYSEVARNIGCPTATRAVARACASNRIALAIPCHRVIRGSGELGGYRWGVERKGALLEKERAAAGKSEADQRSPSQSLLERPDEGAGDHRKHGEHGGNARIAVGSR
jgi:AraC family transcriptional regulator of adaptative response/methylated-DNA-[protein]-cysteine methyltransferase